MLRYVIEVTREATNKNPAPHGKTMHYYKGVCNASEEDESSLKWFAKEFGYTTKENALQDLRSENEKAQRDNAFGYWQTICKIKEMEI